MGEAGSEAREIEEDSESIECELGPIPAGLVSTTLKGVEMVKFLVKSGLFSTSLMQMLQNQSNSSLSNSWLLPHVQAMLTGTSPKSSSSLTDSMRELSCLLVVLVLDLIECLEELFFLQLNSEMFSFLKALVLIGEVTEESSVVDEEALKDDSY